MSFAIVTKEMLGATYYLARDPIEWALEKERAAKLEPAIARMVAHAHGGSVILLEQKREVRGVLGVPDRGPRA